MTASSSISRRGLSTDTSKTHSAIVRQVLERCGGDISVSRSAEPSSPCGSLR